jgi:hypothetical protein
MMRREWLASVTMRAKIEMALVYSFCRRNARRNNKVRTYIPYKGEPEPRQSVSPSVPPHLSQAENDPSLDPQRKKLKGKIPGKNTAKSLHVIGRMPPKKTAHKSSHLPVFSLNRTYILELCSLLQRAPFIRCRYGERTTTHHVAIWLLLDPAELSLGLEFEWLFISGVGG